MTGPEPSAGGTNPDGSPKEPGQQFEEIEQVQRQARRKKRRRVIDCIEKSRQRDREELEAEARRALEYLERRLTQEPKDKNDETLS